MKGADMILLCAGLGGGTGSGALPVFAQLARELHALTIAFVTLPFPFEGKKRMRKMCIRDRYSDGFDRLL